MSWFVAHLIFQIISGDGDHTPQFEEQLKLISARDSKNAFEKASFIGMEGQDSFLNQSLEKVEWKYIGVAELIKINALEDGTELFSKIIEIENADNYVDFIQQKNDELESRLLSLKTNAIG